MTDHQIIWCSVGLAPNGRDLRVTLEDGSAANYKTMRDLRLGLAGFAEARLGVSRMNVEIALTR